MILALALTATLAAAPPRTVYVGAYLDDVSDFDLKAGRFKADFRLWVKWLGEADEIPELFFENGELDVHEELGKESDARWHAVQWRVQGTFRGEFPLQAFPFDRQTLPIVLSLPGSQGLLEPDLGASGMSPRFSVTGWQYEPFFTAHSEERALRTDLGSVEYEGKDAHQRLTTFAVEMHRPVVPYLLKFALPLALILLVALLALFLPADRLDVRSAMGITALLSCFAFHYTQSDTLPAVTYLVAADKLFLGSYVFVSGTLVLSIVAYRLFEKRPAAARRADRIGIWGMPAVTVGSLLLLISGQLVREEKARVSPKFERFPPEPLLRVAVPALDSASLGQQLPAVRSALVVRDADGGFQPVLVEQAPAMTNDLVRLLPEGGMRVRWKLRPGATWSDGAPVTVADLEYSAGLVPDPLRVAMDRVDDATLDVTWSARHGEALGGFPLFQARASAALPDAGREQLSRATSGAKLPTAAAYTLSHFEKGVALELTRNPRFAGEPPVFEKVQVSVKAPMDAARALIAGEVDVVPTLTGNSYELLKTAPGVKVLEQPGELLWVLVPRLDVPPFDSLELRRGLLAALDRKAMVKSLRPSPVRVASGWKEAPSLEPATGDTSALHGLTVKLNVAPMHSKDATHALLAQQVEADLTRLGVSVEVVERDDLLQAVQRRDFEGLALVSRDTADPGRFMNVPSQDGRARLEQAEGAHFDDEMVERYAYWQSTLYAERRRFLSSAMQEAWFKRLPMLPLVLTSRLAAVRADLVGPEYGKADSLWWNVATWHHAKDPAGTP